MHSRCYGEKKTYKKKKIDFKEIFVFECERCELKKTNVNINFYSKEACIVCKKVNGYMKKIENSFVHVICALFCDFFEIEDFLTMSFSAKLPLNSIISTLDEVNFVC